VCACRELRIPLAAESRMVSVRLARGSKFPSTGIKSCRCTSENARSSCDVLMMIAASDGFSEQIRLASGARLHCYLLSWAWRPCTMPSDSCSMATGAPSRPRMSIQEGWMSSSSVCLLPDLHLFDLLQRACKLSHLDLPPSARA
jgi:hypothetical protein